LDKLKAILFDSAYGKSTAPVELSVDNGILTLNNISLDENAVLVISPLTIIHEFLDEKYDQREEAYQR